MDTLKEIHSSTFTEFILKPRNNTGLSPLFKGQGVMLGNESLKSLWNSNFLGEMWYAFYSIVDCIKHVKNHTSGLLIIRRSCISYQ